VDCDGLDDSEEYPIRCTITKRGGRIEIDLSGTSRQARTSINGTYIDTKATVGVALKFLLDPDGVFTSGMYRPVDIVIPDGAICSALPPDGVVFAYGESTNALLVAMFQAMADAVGENAVAGDYGAPNIHTAMGRRADGSMWLAAGVAVGHGPWGATKAGDADSYSTFYQANSLDTAVEASEADSPVVILRREYLPDTAGAGFNRGGGAVLTDFTFLEPAVHNLITLRFKKASGIGVRGGQDGTTGGVWQWPAQPGAATALPGTDRDSYRTAVRVAGRLDKDSGAASAAGDYYWFGRDRSWPTDPKAIWRYVTNAGGGWGDPLERDPQRVLRDVRDGYVTPAGALRDYGVVVQGDAESDPEGLAVDQVATNQSRLRLRPAR